MEGGGVTSPQHHAQEPKTDGRESDLTFVYAMQVKQVMVLLVEHIPFEKVPELDKKKNV